MIIQPDDTICILFDDIGKERLLNIIIDVLERYNVQQVHTIAESIVDAFLCELEQIEVDE